MPDVHATTRIGVVPVLAAPFRPDQSLEAEALEPLMEFAAAAGVRAVCLPAYGTEFYKLSEAERFELVGVAVRFARSRLSVMGQSNHPSPALAAEIARRNEGLGAGIISFALPRQFNYGEEVLLRYAEKIAKAVSVPVLVQDFNPGGPSVGAEFARRLKETAPNFCYLKLEEPMMGPKIRSIYAATKGVGVLEGWGGMYMLQLAGAELAGIMPGLAMADLFVAAFDKVQKGDVAGAAAIHTAILPQILVALQSMEMFHHCEKRLLAARGLLKSVQVRDPAIEIEPEMAAHIELVNRLALAEVTRSGLT